MPAAPAMPAASTFVTMPPLPTDEPVPPIVTASRSSVVATSGTRRAPRRDGGPSYRESTSVRSTSPCAPTMSATRAARRSLSPKRISCVATVSFSLTIGTMPSSRSRSIVRRAFV